MNHNNRQTVGLPSPSGGQYELDRADNVIDFVAERDRRLSSERRKLRYKGLPLIGPNRPPDFVTPMACEYLNAA